MRRFLWAALLAVSVCSCGKPPARGIRVVELSGSAYERGKTHGRTLQTEIHAVLDRFRAHAERMHSVRIDSIRSGYLAKVKYTESIRRWNPGLLDEVRGIADGAGVDFEAVLLFQMGEEFLARLEETRPKHCTSIGTGRTESSPCIVAQNMDAPYFLHGFPTLLRIRYDSLNLETFVLTAPGLIALNGMNSRGIGVTANALPGLNPALEGLPVAFVLRTVLEQPTFEQAVQFLRSVEHAKAQNYLMGGPEEAVSLECIGREAHPFRSPDNSNLTYHTNHFLARAHPSNGDYCSRLETMKAYLSDHAYRVGFEEIREILSSTEWNAGRPISHAFCYGSTIMVLSSPPELYLAPGQPDQYDYVRFAFQE